MDKKLTNRFSSHSSFLTLLDLLRYRAKSQPDQKAYTFLLDGESEEVSISYAELDRQARAIAAKLQSYHAAGERALLLYPPSLEYIAAFFGCLYAGVVAVPVYPPDPMRLNKTLPRLSAIVKSSQAKFALTTELILSMSEVVFEHAPDLKKLEWISTTELSGHEAAWKEPSVSSQTLAFLQYTSGSTGHPKGVMLTHQNLLANERMIGEAFGHDAHASVVGWLPLYHDMGLIGNMLNPLYHGVHCVLMSPLHFLEKPLRWLQAISHYRATTSGGPNFAYDLCVRKIRHPEQANLDLSSWVLAFCGAEPIRLPTVEKFIKTFEPYGFRREAFYPCYGLAEATLMVSGSQKGRGAVVKSFHKHSLKDHRVLEEEVLAGESGQTLVGSGSKLGEERVLIVDPETLTECQVGEIGEIWVSGPHVAQGYWNQPQETKEVFEAYLAGTEEGPFLRTGDLGFFNHDELFVTGRLKDMIIIRGENHYAHDIELSVEKSHPALRPGCGVAFSVEENGEEKLVLVQELERRFQTPSSAPSAIQRNHDPQVEAFTPEISEAPPVDEIVAAIRRVVAAYHGLKVFAVVLVKAGSISKTSSGKLQRRACKDQFQSNSLSVIFQWRAQSAQPQTADATKETKPSVITSEQTKNPEALDFFF